MTRNILAVAVHPDDETLGCGGALIKHAAIGDRIHSLIVTAMVPELFSSARIASREQEIIEVADAYGFASVHRLGFPTTRLDTLSDADLIGGFSRVFEEIQPHTVYLPFHADVHSDHRRAFEAAYACTKSFRHAYVKRVLMMEVLSETEFAPALPQASFAPNVYCDITGHLERKLAILQLYRGEVAAAPFPRSPETVRALAAYRGAVAGCDHAESFMLLKDVY